VDATQDFHLACHLNHFLQPCVYLPNFGLWEYWSTIGHVRIIFYDLVINIILVVSLQVATNYLYNCYISLLCSQVINPVCWCRVDKYYYHNCSTLTCRSTHYLRVVAFRRILSSFRNMLILLVCVEEWGEEHICSSSTLILVLHTMDLILCKKGHEVYSNLNY